MVSVDGVGPELTCNQGSTWRGGGGGLAKCLVICLISESEFRENSLGVSGEKACFLSQALSFTL